MTATVVAEAPMPADIDLLLAFGQRCSDDSICFRFLQTRRLPTAAEQDPVVAIDGRERCALAVVVAGDIIAVGRWIATEKQPIPDLALLVEDAHQGLGIGSELLRRLAE